MMLLMCEDAHHLQVWMWHIVHPFHHNQTWNFDQSSGHIYPRDHPERILTASDGKNFQDGAPVGLSLPKGVADVSQQWELTADGEIRLKAFPTVYMTLGSDTRRDRTEVPMCQTAVADCSDICSYRCVCGDVCLTGRRAAAAAVERGARCGPARSAATRHRTCCPLALGAHCATLVRRLLL